MRLRSKKKHPTALTVPNPEAESESTSPQRSVVDPSSLTTVINYQLQSPLFGTLPPEIRNRIFRLACTTYEDPRRPYAFDDWCNRPGQKFCLTISCALLRTCRLAYAEARLVPVAMNAHTFWYGSQRAPRDVKFASDAEGYFSRLSTEQREQVNEVHVFAQQCTIEGGRTVPDVWPPEALACMLHVGKTLKRLKVTVRHTDWWFWESGNALNMSKILIRSGRSRFMAQFTHTPALEVFELEMETIEEKLDQLNAIIAQFQLYRPMLNEGERVLVPLECTETQKWIGPAFYGGRSVTGRYNFEQPGAVRTRSLWLWPALPPPPPQTHNYVVRSVRWRAQNVVKADETG